VCQAWQRHSKGARSVPAAGIKECPVRARVRRETRTAAVTQRLRSTSTSSSSIRTCRMICELRADSCFCPSPSRRRRAPPIV